jgi:hypothetical protein
MRAFLTELGFPQPSLSLMLLANQLAIQLRAIQSTMAA